MAESPAEMIESLEMEGASGCLRVDGAGGQHAQVYLMKGHIYHAEGTAGEGEAALVEALSWLGASTSFDPSAPMSTRATIDFSESEVVVLPEVWPEEALREEEKHFGFENGVSSGQALLVLAGLFVVVVLAILVLSRKY